MKVALFTDTFTPQINGVTKTLDRLIEYFDQEGIDYLVFAPDASLENANTFEENIQRMISFSFFLYPECRLSVPNYFKISQRLAEYKPDLIHIVTPFNLGLCGLKYAQDNNIPLVSSYHTNFTHYLDYYNLKFLEKAIWKFFKWFHSYSERNFCPSEDTLDTLKEQGIKNLEVWGRGINIDLYSPIYREQKWVRKYNLEEKIKLLYVGRLAPEKNIKLLMVSLDKLNQKYYDQIELLITGDGPLLKELKKEAPQNVTFTGYLTGKELASLYATADVFTFPSVTETYGNVVLEAMASGLPVVGVLAGGVKENLIDGYNGLATTEDDVEKFSTNLEEIITNQQLRKRLALNARKYAINHSWDQIFNKLVNSYREVIASQYQNKNFISA